MSKTLSGTITLNDTLTLVRTAQKLPSPWQIQLQTTGQQTKFTISDPTGKSTIDSQMDLIALTLTAKNVGEGRINITDLLGTDSDGDFSASQAAYKANVTQSTSTFLASLTADKGTLSPTFSANVTRYTLTVPYDTTQVSLFATTQNKNSLISGAGPVTLNDQKKTVDIVVTAQDKSTSTITVQIVRAEAQSKSAQLTQTQVPQSAPQNGALLIVLIVFGIGVAGISIIVIGLLRQRKRR